MSKHRNPHIDVTEGKPGAEPERIEAENRRTDRLADRVIAADRTPGPGSNRSPFSSARDMKPRMHGQHEPTTGDSHVRDKLPKSRFTDPLSRRWTGR